MTNFLKCLAFISVIFSAACSQVFSPHMINDIIKYYSKLSMVHEFSCHKKDSVLLVNTLSKSGHQANVLPIDTPLLPYPLPPNHAVFVFNLHCNNASILINRANGEDLFSSPYKWLIYYNSTLITIDQVMEKFSHIDILIDSDVTLGQMQENGTFVLQKIFKRRLGTPIVVEDMGFWSKSDGLVVGDFYQKITAKRRMNLMGTTLKSCMVITHNDSLNHLLDKRDKHIDSIAKVSYVLNQHLSDIINVTLEYTMQNTWGYQLNDSDWSGMIGELTRKEVDIGDTPLFLTSDRVDIIDYIAMMTPTRSKFVFRQPKLSYVTNVFTLPFNDSVWLSTIALVIVTGLVLFIVVKWEWHKQKYTIEKDSSNQPELRDSFSDTVFLSFGALCQQGASAIPFSLPGRITTIFLFVSLMFLYTSYSANIVALLQSSSTSIRGLEDLLKSRLQVGVDDTVFNHFYFPNATEPIRRAIYLQKVAPPGKQPSFMTIEEGVRRMRQGLFAFHMETGSGYKIVSETFHEDEKCGLQEIQYLQVPDPWLSIQKNSSYKEILKIGLHVIQETGLQYRENSLIYSKKPLCISRGSSFISVGLVDCYPAAVVLAGGIIVAVGVFLLETYINYRLAIYKGKRLSLMEVIGTKTMANMDQPIPFTK